MTTYVFCPRISEGAFELTRALGATRLRRFDGMDFWNKRQKLVVKEGDAVICWGTSVPELDGIRVLNGLDAPVNKMKEWEKLMAAGVPTIHIYTKAPPGQKLLPRVAVHQGGRDLLVTPLFPDYYVVKELLVKEYRIHSFAGKSIRAGLKVPRDGFRVVTEAEWEPTQGKLHPWVRSYDGGWRVNYDGFQSTSALRKIAHKSIAALGLTFGAVDIGELADGTLKVLEVNRAPGIEGGSTQSYVRAVNKWLKGVVEVDEVV